MNYRKKIVLFIAFAIIIFLVGGYLFQYPERVGICAPNNLECIDFFVFDLQQPIRSALPLVIVTLIVLLFTSERIYHTWKKFALFAIPLEVLWIASTPTYCGGIVCFDKNAVAWFASSLFLVISLIIILVSSLHKKVSQN